MDLRPWQRRFLTAATAPGIRTAVLSLPRGNGKSTLAAYLAAGSASLPTLQPGLRLCIERRRRKARPGSVLGSGSAVPCQVLTALDTARRQ